MGHVSTTGLFEASDIEAYSDCVTPALIWSVVRPPKETSNKEVKIEVASIVNKGLR
jgi:hypothetical protein